MSKIMYCEKCGNVYKVLLNKKCNFCKTEMKMLPEDIKNKYHLFSNDWSELSDREINKRKENFVNGELKTNPSFSWACYIRLVRTQNGLDPNFTEWKKEEKLQSIKVTCPYCKSTNTSKITIANKAAHTAIFGVWSIARNTKEWHCNNCRSDF